MRAWSTQVRVSGRNVGGQCTQVRGSGRVLHVYLLLKNKYHILVHQKWQKTKMYHVYYTLKTYISVYTIRVYPAHMVCAVRTVNTYMATLLMVQQL
jgi:hypothetical protein